MLIAFAEKLFQQFAAFRFLDAAIHFGPVVAGGLREPNGAVLDRSAFGVGGAVIEAANAGMADGRRAHGARL